MTMIKLRREHYRLALVLKSLFFPFTCHETINALVKKGYVIAPIPLMPHPPPGTRAYVSGRIARKGGCEVEVDDHRKIVACEGGSAETVVKTLKELISVAKEDLFVDIDGEIDYLELIATYVVTAGKSPIDTIARAFDDSAYLKRIRSELGINASVFQFTLNLKEYRPGSRDWLDIKVSPSLILPDHDYDVQLVYRGRNADSVFEFATTLSLVVEKLISIIES